MPMFRFFKRRDGYEKVEFQHDDSFRVFKSRELIVATDKFSPGRVLGEGGRVYKGILKDGQEVAVKRFEEQEDLWAEVRMLNCVEHPNIVKMIGYCDKEKDHIIVYEFVPLRSLDLHLHDLKPGKTPLDWKTRMKIAMGVAKALEYLHDQKDPPVIYSGLKRSSILLDENYDPKLSDFGCAEHGPTLNHTAANRKFSLCYLGPEYPMTGYLSLKSDVYSFGVVLLELISGKKAINGYNNVVLWARPLLNHRKKFPEIADPLMEGKYPHRGLVQALNLAKWCLQEDFRKRPLTEEVVMFLTNLAPLSQISEAA
ncbi:hypothetical protein C5167_000554 [Papaver somniferum]|uniref:Protein kinase domain-containing protein n=1 Tax=Papaver somniferum TaxID=3469 RepID=A0A4Y7KSV5_PAPSO|nr:serine/threonine-protein kinase PBL27-like isoform X2 [Papaver somniferum]RZC76433.1 hypothetical protein C5167_000554 [Papaver somniferum]